MEYRTGGYDRAIRANKVRVFDPEREGRLSAAHAGNRLEPIGKRVPYQIQLPHRSLLDHHSRRDLQFRLLDQHY
jgi:hypothetical protein